MSIIKVLLLDSENLTDLLIDKVKEIKVHGISDIFCYLEQDKSKKDNISFLVTSFNKGINSHIDLAKSLYLPLNTSLYNLLVYWTIKQCDETITDHVIDQIFKNA